MDAPVGRSIVLAGVMLKMGAFGLVRLMEIRFLYQWGGVGYLVSLIGLIGFGLASVICLRLVDYKVIVAFSSVGHISVAVVGLLVGLGWGFLGSLYVFMGHGLVSPALFFLGGVLYSRSRSRLTVGGGRVRSS